MGRPPKSTRDHQRAGTYVPSRHGHRNDETVTSGEPERPGWVKEDLVANWMWDTILGHTAAGVLSRPDTVLLAGTCRWFSVWHGLMAQGTPTYKDVVQAAAAWKAVTTGLGKLGVSPVDRCRLTARAPAKADDPKDKFFKVVGA